MRRRPWLMGADVILFVVALFLFSLIAGMLLRRHRITVVRPKLLAAFLDVGNGDCTLLKTAAGQAILVDTGPAASGSLVAATLKRQGVRDIDLVVLASGNANEVGGLPAILQAGVTVKQVWEGPGIAESPALHDLRSDLKTAGASASAAYGGRIYRQDGFVFGVLWPPTPTQPLICRVDEGQTSMILAGPAKAAEMDQLLAGKGHSLDCDVLQTADGGANGATTAEMLRRSTPSVAVISSGPVNPPGAKTLQLLAAAGAAVWQTDAQGPISVFSDGHGPLIVTAQHL